MVSNPNLTILSAKGAALFFGRLLDLEEEDDALDCSVMVEMVEPVDGEGVFFLLASSFIFSVRSGFRFLCDLDFVVPVLRPILVLELLA